MADGQSYPSPTEGQQLGDGPFYGRVGMPEQSPPPQEVPDDLQLRADLARSLAPLTDDQQQQLDQALQHPSQYDLDRDSLLLQQPAQNHIGAADTSAKRKDQRSKVSKACDECRRKKIRCDAPSEDGTEPCANCRRTSSQCTYARQQLKRGPSKGYIRELADRLKDLEEHTRMQTELQFGQQPQHTQLATNLGLTDDFLSGDLPSETTPQPNGQKRSFEVMSGDDTQSNERPAPRIERPRDASDGADDSRAVRAFQPFFSPVGVEPSGRGTSGTPLDSGPLDGPAITDWDEDIIDEYYQLIHQTFPLLPHSKNNLRYRLSSCPAGLREAFVTVLACMMRTFPSSKLRDWRSYASNMKRAGDLLSGYPFEEPASHTPATDLVYLQTLILMALAADNDGPANVSGRSGHSRSEWLARAAGVAGQLKINLKRPPKAFVTEGDPDSEDRLSRRVWWVLFILDRWHASSTADFLKIPERSDILLPEDQILLGESTYHLARLSFIIGHFATILTTSQVPETDVMAPSNPASALLGMTLAGEIDRFRESVEPVWGSLNLVHLSYHHSHLLIKRLNSTAHPTDLVGHALKVATVLNQRQTPITPLNHHFAALSAMTLCELISHPTTRVDAVKGLEQLAEALGQGRGLSGNTTDSMGWDSAIRTLVTNKTRDSVLAGGDALAGLDSSSAAVMDDTTVLARADGNTAASAPAQRGGPSGKFDPSVLTRYGYLRALGQGKFET